MTHTSLEAYEPPQGPPDGMLVHPLTAEAIDLVNAPDDELASFLKALKDDAANLGQAKRIVEQEILRRMDQAAEWTRRAGPYQLRSLSPEPAEEFDAAALRSDLLELVDEEVLGIQAVDAAVETVVTYKAKKGGINKLRKLGGRVKEVIDRHSFTSEKRRYVQVQRVGE